MSEAQQVQVNNTSEIDINDIESKASNSQTKLPELKELANKLKIKITKMKKDDIRKAILTKTLIL